MASKSNQQIALSCAVSDRAVAADIAQALRAAGYSVAPIEMGPQQVTETYGAPGAVVVVWSAASAASKWVAQEAKTALARNALVEISLQSVRGDAPPAPLPPIGFEGWDHQPGHPAMKALRKRLRPLVGGPRRGAAISVTQATPWALGLAVVLASVAAIGASLATRAPAVAMAPAAQPSRPIVTTGPIEGAAVATAGAEKLRTAAPLRDVTPSPREVSATIEAGAGPGDRDRGFSREDIAEMKKRRQPRAKPEDGAAPEERPPEGPPM